MASNRRRQLSIRDRALLMSLEQKHADELKNKSSDHSRLFLSEMGTYLNVYLPKLQKTAKSVATMRSSLSVFVRYLRNVKKIEIEKFKIQDCTIGLVTDWLSYEIEEHHCSAASRNKHLSVLRGYMEYLSHEDHAALECFIKLSQVRQLQVPETPKEILSNEQVLLIIKEAANLYKGMRDATMLLFLYETAIRVSELVELTKDKLTLSMEAPHVLIFGKGKKFRRVNLNSQLAQIMRKYMDKMHKDTADDAPLFYSLKKGRPGALTSRSVQYILEKCADAARLIDPSIPERVHPHMLRRSKATSMLRQGTPLALISQLLGHSSMDTTGKYAKYSNEDLAEAVEKTSLADQAENKEWTEDEVDEFIRACSLTV